MACRRHKKKNYKGEKAQLLKGEIREASEILIRSQDADERIFIPETVELPDCGRTVDRSQNKSDYTEVPAIIKQWQKRRGHPTKGPNAGEEWRTKQMGGWIVRGGRVMGADSSLPGGRQFWKSAGEVGGARGLLHPGKSKREIQRRCQLPANRYVSRRS